MVPSVVGSLNEKDEKAKKAKQPIVIWPEWTEQDIAQEKWVRLLSHCTIILTMSFSNFFLNGKNNSWLLVTTKCL